MDEMGRRRKGWAVAPPSPVPAAGIRVWYADRGDAGHRLDHALVRHLAGLPSISRSQVQAWIAAGRVRVAGAVVTRPAARLAAGDEVAVELPAALLRRRRARPLAAQCLPLAVLYEDEHLLAIDKPAGLVVHPTGRYRDGTLANALAWYLGTGAAAAGPAGAGAAEFGAPGPVPAPGAAGNLDAASDPKSSEAEQGPGPGLVHRLDRGTSGVLLVAKTRAAHAGLARAIKARSIEKDYLAVVYGRAPLPKGRIELKLRRDPGHGARVIASRTEGQTAVTLYELLAEVAVPAPVCPPGGGAVGDADAAGSGARPSPGPPLGPASAAAGVSSAWLSVLRCRLVTGRTHQIRAHLAALGLPVVGDPLYGEPRHRGIAEPALAALCRDFPRQALHAWRLALRHPVTGQPLELLAPLPADLRRLMEGAGLAEGGSPILDALAAGGPRR
jgi:23S rRNA pseudouridine1911/1915/1917 synthase